MPITIWTSKDGQLFSCQGVDYRSDLLGFNFLVRFGDAQGFMVRQLLTLQLGQVHLQLFDHHGRGDRLVACRHNHRKTQCCQLLLPPTHQLWSKTNDLIIALIAFPVAYGDCNSILEQRDLLMVQSRQSHGPPCSKRAWLLALV